MKRLPPLTGIEAFIQVARLGSIKAAAESLALSSPALTRRVQALERHVGRPLFDRHHQALQLNHDGERLLAAIGPAVDTLALAMEQATGHNELMRLRLGTMPLFASHRLIPGLARLRLLHPELHVDIDTGPFILARLDEGIDAAVVLAKEIDPGLYSRRLGTNRSVAIGATALLEGPDALRAPADIARTTVLLHRDLPDSFDIWRRAMGLPGMEPAAVDHFDSGQLILDAAAQGLGIAFMLDIHLHEARDTRLVQLFDSAPSPYSYWFACRRPALGRRSVKLFHDWLVEELGEEQPSPSDQVLATA
ncbi:MAG TPA: LysR substrate-binding domain-containing protein [Allosphingosinicella sp.]